MKKQANTQDEYLGQIKVEAKSAVVANKDLERKVTEAENECVKLQK